VVFVASRVDEATSGQVTRAIRSQLSDLNVRFQLHWVDRLPPGLPEQVDVARRIGRQQRALVVLWCSHPSAEKVFLYITRFHGERILVRRVDRKRDGTLGRFEAIGVIVRSGVEAILRGGRIGIRPPHRPRLSPRPRPPPRPPLRPPIARGSILALETGYALTGFARAEPVLHAGVVGLSMGLHRHWVLRLGYRFAPGITVERRDLGVELRLFQHTLRLGACFRWHIGRWTVAAQAGAVLNLQDYEPVARPPLVAEPDGMDVTVGVDLLAEAAWRLRPWLELFVGLGVTVLMWNRSYHMHTQGKEHLVLDPFLVQPQLVAGLRLRVF
jgi:hypothetical protein